VGVVPAVGLQVPAERRLELERPRLLLAEQLVGLAVGAETAPWWPRVPMGSSCPARRSSAIRPALVCWMRYDSMSMFCCTSRGSSVRSPGTSRRRVAGEDVELLEVGVGEREDVREEAIEADVVRELPAEIPALGRPSP
jgi:hypothetical protein